MSDDTKPKPARRKTEWWLLTGGVFDAQMSRMYSGPYSTREDAFVARVSIEKLRGANDLWVDSRKVPVQQCSSQGGSE